MRGFGKKVYRENVVINMTNLDTPKIDTILSRFPAVAENIFKELDSKSMVKCRKVSVPWQNFIDNQKFIWIRRMQKRSGNMEQFYEQWKLVIRNTPTDHVKELSKSLEQLFDKILRNKIDFENVTSGRKSQWAPLHATASQGHLELSRYIIQKTGDKNPTGSFDITPLHFAAYNGHTEVCRHIVELVDDKNPFNDKGHSPLTIAASNGHLEVYQLIAELLEDGNPSNYDGSLHLASEAGHLEVCKYIMDNLLDKNPPAVGGINDGLTPYHIAADFGQLEVCKLFLETLADKNPFDTLHLYTPLHCAASFGHLEVCKLISETIEDKNPVAIDGVVPLHCAALGGHLEILRLFLHNGVDRRSIYYNGWTPIQIAASEGHFRSCLLLMGNLQDIVSFFKGIKIWYNNSTKAKILVNTLILLFGAMVIMVIISVLFQYGNFI